MAHVLTTIGTGPNRLVVPSPRDRSSRTDRPVPFLGSQRFVVEVHLFGTPEDGAGSQKGGGNGDQGDVVKEKDIGIRMLLFDIIC